MSLKLKLITAGLLAANIALSYATTTGSCVKAWFTSDSESKLLNFSVRNTCTQSISQKQLTNLKFIVVNPESYGVTTLYGNHLFLNGEESATWTTLFNISSTNQAVGSFISADGNIVPLNLESAGQSNWIRSGNDYLPIDAKGATANLSIVNNISGELLYNLAPTSIDNKCQGSNCSCSNSSRIQITGLTRSKRIAAATSNVTISDLTCKKSTKTCQAGVFINNIPRGVTNNFPVVNIIDPDSKVVLATLSMITTCHAESAGSLTRGVEKSNPLKASAGLKFW